MDPEYAPLASVARKTTGVVVERFRSLKDVVIEVGMQKQESWAYKIGSENAGVLLGDIERLLDVLGLKAVDKSKTCIDRDVLQAWRTIAAAAMNEPKKLEWE